MSVALMLSGQGSQRPGMGLDLLDVPQVNEAFQAASDVLGWDVPAFLERCTAEELNDTRRAQPALAALSIGIANALIEAGLQPRAVLGFSLGQASALAVSGMLTLEDTLRFIQTRCEVMAQAAEERPGAMSALLKADAASVAEVCEACAQGEVLVPANYNCPGQIVISGTPDAVARAEEAWGAQGRRAARLATAGAFHSPLMEDAARRLRAYLDDVAFQEARIPLIDNVTAQPLTAAQAPARLAEHLVSPVRFDESVARLRSQGADVFVEAGYGSVLANLVKRIDKATTRACVQDRPSFDAFVAALSETAPASDL